MRYTERLSDAGIEPSVDSGGDSYDNAFAETINGLFKAEVIHRRGPWRSVEAVELATFEWVDRFNSRRLFEPIGNILPAEASDDERRGPGDLRRARRGMIGSKIAASRRTTGTGIAALDEELPSVANRRILLPSIKAGEDKHDRAHHSSFSFSVASRISLFGQFDGSCGSSDTSTGYGGALGRKLGCCPRAAQRS